LIRRRYTHHAQLTTPTSRTSTESTPSHIGGPPTVNSDGNAMFKTTPTTRYGSVTSPIRSPLPTRALMFTTAPSHSNLTQLERRAPPMYWSSTASSVTPVKLMLGSS
jgi:hypothetical protein